MAVNTVLAGPSFTTLRDTAFDRADTLADSGPQRILILENNGYQRESVAETWEDTYSPLRAQITDFSSFVMKAHERLYGPYPDIGTFERRRIIEQALEDVDRDGTLSNARQHRDSFSELFLELEAANVLTPTAVRERLENTTLDTHYIDPVAKAFEAYTEYRSDIAHPEARPRNQKAAEIATAETPLTEAFPTVDTVIVSGLLDPSPVEANVLERLSDDFEVLYVLPHTQRDAQDGQANPVIRRTRNTLADLGFEFETIAPATEQPLHDVASKMYTPQASPEQSYPELAWNRAPTPDREVRHVARQIRHDLATRAYTPDDILVLVPGLLSYREHIADVFSAYGIDRAMNLGVFLEHTYAGRAILDTLSLCDNPTATVVTEIATNPVVDLPDVDAAELVDIERRLYTADIDRFQAELETSTKGVDALLDIARDVAEASPDTFVAAFRDLLAYLGLDDSDAISVDGTQTQVTYETRAIQRIQRSLDSVEKVIQTCDLDDPLRELTDGIEGLRIPAPQTDPTGRVEIIGLQDTPMADFERLYVLGATDEHLPGSDDRPRFFETVGTALDLFAEHESRDRARHRLCTLLANAESAHITTPERTSDDDQLLESPIIDELARVAGLTPNEGFDNERRGSTEDLQRAIGLSGADPDDLSIAVEQASSGAFEREQATFTQNGIKCATHRSETTLTTHDAQLNDTPLENLNERLTHRPFSHNRLSSYATCGFKYLLSEGLGFEEPDTIDPELDHRLVGTVVHETLETFFIELQTDSEPVDLASFDREELERRLLAAVEQTLTENDYPIASAFDERLISILCAGLASEAENPYYHAVGTEAAHQSGRGVFVRFLETELETDTDAKPLYFEAEFGNDRPVLDNDGTPLPVGGVIDRVDVTPDRSSATVFDYKTSRRNRIYTLEKHAIGGMNFQLPLYARAAHTLLPDVDTPIEAAYYMIRPDPEINRFGKLSRRLDDEVYAQFLETATPERIETAIEALEQGAFHPTVAGEDAAQCEYCAFQDVCDVRHHRREAIIDEIEGDDNIYVPDAAQTDDWDELIGQLAPAQGGDIDV
jgi:ATP-dependent helicase/nuclease subunit B